jgi:beta-catenin-like protein 1
LNERVTEDAKAVYQTLAIFEHLMEDRPEIAEMATKTPLINFIIKRLRTQDFDDNAVYCSEILSIMAQSGGRPCQQALMQAGVIEACVELIRPYALEKNAELSEEVEYTQNLTNIMCVCMMYLQPEAQQRFFDSDGAMAAMIQALHKKRSIWSGAIKTISYAVTDHAGNCEAFIDAGGLKSIFAAFMGKSIKKKQRKLYGGSIDEDEEHMLSVLSQLFLNLSDVRYLRLLRKFQEHDCIKVERLLELFIKYFDAVGQAEAKLSAVDDDDLDEQQEEMMLLNLMTSVRFYVTDCTVLYCTVLALVFV